MMHFSLMIIMTQHPIFHKLLKVCLPVLLRLDYVCEYCALNSFASSLIFLNLRSVVCSCVLNIIYFSYGVHSTGKGIIYK